MSAPTPTADGGMTERMREIEERMENGTYWERDTRWAITEIRRLSAALGEAEREMKELREGRLAGALRANTRLETESDALREALRPVIDWAFYHPTGVAIRQDLPLLALVFDRAKAALTPREPQPPTPLCGHIKHSLAGQLICVLPEGHGGMHCDAGDAHVWESPTPAPQPLPHPDIHIAVGPEAIDEVLASAPQPAVEPMTLAELEDFMFVGDRPSPKPAAEGPWKVELAGVADGVRHCWVYGPKFFHHFEGPEGEAQARAIVAALNAQPAATNVNPPQTRPPFEYDAEREDKSQPCDLTHPNARPVTICGWCGEPWSGHAQPAADSLPADIEAHLVEAEQWLNAMHYNAPGEFPYFAKLDWISWAVKTLRKQPAAGGGGDTELRDALRPFAKIEVPPNADPGTWVATTVYCNDQVTAHSVLRARAALGEE